MIDFNALNPLMTAFELFTLNEKYKTEQPTAQEVERVKIELDNILQTLCAFEQAFSKVRETVQHNFEQRVLENVKSTEYLEKINHSIEAFGILEKNLGNIIYIRLFPSIAQNIYYCCENLKTITECDSQDIALKMLNATIRFAKELKSYFAVKNATESVEKIISTLGKIHQETTVLWQSLLSKHFELKKMVQQTQALNHSMQSLSIQEEVNVDVNDIAEEVIDFLDSQKNKNGIYELKQDITPLLEKYTPVLESKEMLDDLCQKIFSTVSCKIPTTKTAISEYSPSVKIAEKIYRNIVIHRWLLEGVNTLSSEPVSHHTASASMLWQRTYDAFEYICVLLTYNKVPVGANHLHYDMLCFYYDILHTYQKDFLANSNKEKQYLGLFAFRHNYASLSFKYNGGQNIDGLEDSLALVKDKIPESLYHSQQKNVEKLFSEFTESAHTPGLEIARVIDDFFLKFPSVLNDFVQNAEQGENNKKLNILIKLQAYEKKNSILLKKLKKEVKQNPENISKEFKNICTMLDQIKNTQYTEKQKVDILLVIENILKNWDEFFGDALPDFRGKITREKIKEINSIVVEHKEKLKKSIKLNQVKNEASNAELNKQMKLLQRKKKGMSPEERAQEQAEAEAKAKAKAQAEAEAKAKAQAEARAKAEAEAKAKAQAEAEAKAKAKAQAEAQAKANKSAECSTMKIQDYNAQIYSLFFQGAAQKNYGELITSKMLSSLIPFAQSLDQESLEKIKQYMHKLDMMDKDERSQIFSPIAQVLSVFIEQIIRVKAKNKDVSKADIKDQLELFFEKISNNGFDPDKNSLEKSTLSLLNGKFNPVVEDVVQVDYPSVYVPFYANQNMHNMGSSIDLNDSNTRKNSYK